LEKSPNFPENHNKLQKVTTLGKQMAALSPACCLPACQPAIYISL
jgi:hypothetical protein